MVYYLGKDVIHVKLNWLLNLLLIVALVLLGQSLLMDKTYFQGSIPAPVQNSLIPPRTMAILGDEGEVNIKLLAEYELKGVVKEKKRYKDYPSQISRYDIVIAWGELNSEALDPHIKYSQGSRWYYYKYSPEFPRDASYIVENSANVHLVHADDKVLKEIKKIDTDDYVSIEGYLIEVTFTNGPWRSSLTRTDTGNGACEIMYVTDIDIVD